MGVKFHLSLRCGAIAAALCLASSSLAPAATLTRHFTGTITSAKGVAFSVGDPIVGSFTWDSTTLSEIPLEGDLALYQTASPIAPNSLHVTIGSSVLPAITNEKFSVVVGDNAQPPAVPSTMDMVAIGRTTSSAAPGELSGITVAFGDSDLTHLSGNALPSEEQMANFEIGQLTLNFAPSLTVAGSAIGSIQLVPIPEPGTLSLSVAGSVILLGAFARRLLT